MTSRLHPNTSLSPPEKYKERLALPAEFEEHRPLSEVNPASERKEHRNPSQPAIRGIIPPSVPKSVQIPPIALAGWRLVVDTGPRALAAVFALFALLGLWPRCVEITWYKQLVSIRYHTSSKQLYKSLAVIFNKWTTIVI
jgi:hypothetical protein